MFKFEISPTPSVGKNAPTKANVDKIKGDIKLGRRRSPRITKMILEGEVKGVLEENKEHEEGDDDGGDDNGGGVDDDAGSGDSDSEKTVSDQAEAGVDVDKTVNSFLSSVDKECNEAELLEITTDVIAGRVKFAVKKRATRSLHEDVLKDIVKKEVVSTVQSPVQSPEEACDLAQADNTFTSPKCAQGEIVSKGGQQEPMKPVYSLAAMEQPSFSLGLTQTPPEKKEIVLALGNQVAKLNPGIDDKEVKGKDVGVAKELKKAVYVRQGIKERRQPKRKCVQRVQNTKKSKKVAEKDLEVEQIETTTTTQEDQTQEPPYIHELGPMEVNFDTWMHSMLEKDSQVKLPVVVFRSSDEIENWSYTTDSIFSDNGEIPVEKTPMADPSWEYRHRDLLSDIASNLLDEWIRKYNQNELTMKDCPFRNNEANIFCNIHQFYELLHSKYEVGAEV